MNRRTKDRVDLRLQCRLGPQKVLSVASAGQSQIIGLTQNVSRCGLLMRWLEDVELPAPGSDLTVDIDLPADASFGPRLMRCRATVVRIIRNAEGLLAVGMKIRNIRFVAPTPSSKKRAAAAVAGGTPTQWELESIRGPPKGSINPMLMPTASSERAVKSAVVVSAQEQAREKIPFIARFLPSLTDLAFLMPLIFLFLKLDGARTLLGDGDTGSHVRTGEWIMAHGAVPDNDIFSFSRPGAPWFAWEWLWDVLVAVLHQRWGMSAVVAASALLFRLIRRYCGNGLVAIAVTLLATGGCAIHWLARPHLFSLLFLTVTLHITMRGAEGRTRLLAWLVPLTLLWTNLHGGFFIIFLVLLCYIANGLVNAAIEKDPHARRVWLAGLRPWLVTFAACFAVTFINPYGWQLHKHVVEYIIDPYSLNHITEFQSMNFHAPVSVYFEPLMILTIVVALSDASNRRFAEVFLALGWLHLALIAQRNLPLYTIAAARSRPAEFPPPLLTPATPRARLRDGSDAPSAGSAVPRPASRKPTGFRAFIWSAPFLICWLTLILLSTPPAQGVTGRNPLALFTSTYDPQFYPEKALAQLRTPETHHIFAEDEWGDYLIYHLYPNKKVFVDGRSDFYGDDFGERYLDIMNVQHGWQKTLDKYSIDTIVIAPKFALTQTLKISRDWRVVFDDGIALVFRRNVPGPNSPVPSNEGETVVHGLSRADASGRYGMQNHHGRSRGPGDRQFFHPEDYSHQGLKRCSCH